MSQVELNGDEWIWVEVDGAGWRWGMVWQYCKYLVKVNIKENGNDTQKIRCYYDETFDCN